MITPTSATSVVEMSDRNDAPECRPIDQKVESIAVVLDEFPPMQVLRAVQRLAEDPDSAMERSHVITTATNVSSDGSSPDPPVETDMTEENDDD